MFKLENIKATIDDKQILNGIDLEIKPGEIHAIMGPNGSGKSTLAHVIMGHPAYEVTGGSITLAGTDLLELAPDERARQRIFLAFQYPFEVEGLPLKDFLRTAYNAWYAGTDKQIGIKAFNALLEEKMALLKLDRSFVERSLNVGCSGGEKKQAEMLQMAVLQPRIAILDEIDSGLDIDALKIVSEGVNSLRNEERAIILVTHYQRLLDYIKPDHVHVLSDGKIIKSGGPDLALELEEKGYDWVKEAAA